MERRLPPGLSLHLVLDLVPVAGVDASGKVLPTSVSEKHHNRAVLQTLCCPNRAGEYRAGGYAYKYAGIGQEFFCPEERFFSFDHDPGVKRIKIENWGNEAVLDGAQTLNLVIWVWRRRDDLYIGVVFV